MQRHASQPADAVVERQIERAARRRRPIASHPCFDLTRGRPGKGSHAGPAASQNAIIDSSLMP